ncbi:MAG: thrombospondin type 3 repeat-containing protein, partial [Nanoarchaeota archaeon]
MSSQKAVRYLVFGLLCVLLLSSSVSAAFEAQEFFSSLMGKYTSFITGRAAAPDPPSEADSGSIGSGSQGSQGSSSYQPTTSPRVQSEGGVVVVSEAKDGRKTFEIVRPSFKTTTRILTTDVGGGTTEPALVDLDGDGIPDVDDNCPTVINPQQSDCDGDLTGDACDYDFPQNCATSSSDLDGDGVNDGQDNCPFAFNPDQTDLDGDGAGDSCDICPSHRLHDEDGDGALNNACIGGTDCTDQNSAIHPQATEL